MELRFSDLSSKIWSSILRLRCLALNAIIINCMNAGLQMVVTESHFLLEKVIALRLTIVNQTAKSIMVTGMTQLTQKSVKVKQNLREILEQMHTGLWETQPEPWVNTIKKPWDLLSPSLWKPKTLLLMYTTVMLNVLIRWQATDHSTQWTSWVDASVNTQFHSTCHQAFCSSHQTWSYTAWWTFRMILSSSSTSSWKNKSWCWTKLKLNQQPTLPSHNQHNLLWCQVRMKVAIIQLLLSQFFPLLSLLEPFWFADSTKERNKKVKTPKDFQEKNWSELRYIFIIFWIL